MSAEPIQCLRCKMFIAPDFLGASFLCEDCYYEGKREKDDGKDEERYETQDDETED